MQSSHPNGWEDRREIRRLITRLLTHKHLIEVRALGTERYGTISGYFDAEHRESLVEECADLSGNAAGVYFTLNPVSDDLLARAANRCRNWAKHTTADADVLERYWLPLDFDPVRPAGISSTDTEHEAAIRRAAECKAWLRSRGFPPLSLVLADSGNGGHLLVRVNLPNDDKSRELVKHCIEAVALHFSDDSVKVDTTTFNAARIWKIYGTLAAKGDHIPERPHRLARLLEVPKKIRPMTRWRLDRLAATLPTPPKPAADQRRGHFEFDLAKWITAHGLPVVQDKDWQGGHIWVLNPCPWNPAHTNRAAYIIRHSSGAISAGCQHDGCQGKGWHDLRDLYEPGWRETYASTRRITVPEGMPPAMTRAFRRGVEQRLGGGKRKGAS